MNTKNTNVIIKNLDSPLFKDWIFWLWLAATVLPALNILTNASSQDPVSGVTTYDATSGLIDAAVLIVVNWSIFNWLPRTIRVNYRNRRS